MSETDGTIGKLPPPDTFVVTDSGLTLWSPKFLVASVTKCGSAGDRILRIEDGGEVIFVRVLTQEQAGHLARLLTDDALVADTASPLQGRHFHLEPHFGPAKAG
jgi:hypothetical protein